MSRRVRIDSIWSEAIREMSLDPQVILRRARLPHDLFRHRHPAVDFAGYFRLWDAFAVEAGTPHFGLTVGQRVFPSEFHPALFAVLCSPHLGVALQRMSHYQRLMGQLQLDVVFEPEELALQICCEPERTLPFELGVAKLVFWTALARRLTRTSISPMAVTLTQLPEQLERYESFFGVVPELGKQLDLRFAMTDAERPFLSEDTRMWESFEPELRRRLDELGEHSPMSERAAVALFELLPSGRTRVSDVAQMLGIGMRTLQRRLRDEQTSFQAVLDQTRERLARHYLTNTRLSGVEIAFLLGFDDPNSLFRAFNRWTGTTPESVRAASSEDSS